MAAGSFHSAAAFEVPPLTGPVVDRAHIISDHDRAYLDGLIRQVKDASQAQIQVLTVPTLGQETIEQASIQVVDKWKLGMKGTDKGVLLMVAVQEHKVRIEVGRGLEGDIPDITAWQIISDHIVPRFKRGEYSGGIVAGVQAVASIAAPGTASAPPDVRHERREHQSPALVILLLLIFIFLISTPFGRTLLLYSLFTGGGGGSWGSGGGGRDSWGGGGGGFSGGGASGDW